MRYEKGGERDEDRPVIRRDYGGNNGGQSRYDNRRPYDNDRYGNNN